MSGRPTLGEKVREEALSHSAWHFTGEKLLDFLERRWREWAWAAIGSGSTVVWGYVKGLSRLKLTAAGVGAAALIILVWDVVRAARRKEPSNVGVSDAKSSEK